MCKLNIGAQPQPVHNITAKAVVRVRHLTLWKKAVLRICSFSTTVPLAQTEKGCACRSGARRGGTEVKKMVQWHWLENKMLLICPISEPNFAKKSKLSSTYRTITSNQCCGSKYIEFGSGSRILAQFGSGSGSRVISISKEFFLSVESLNC